MASPTQRIFSAPDLATREGRNHVTIYRLLKRMGMTAKFETPSGHKFYDEEQADQLREFCQTAKKTQEA